MSDSPLIDFPEGRKLDEGPNRPKNWFGYVDGLPDASEARIEWAARHFVRASEDEYERDGRYWIEKSTGERYVIAKGDPVLASDPRDTGIEAFIVRDDDCIIFLCTPGHATSVTRVELGSVGVVRVS
jgi:hypothetical protein